MLNFLSFYNVNCYIQNIIQFETIETKIQTDDDNAHKASIKWHSDT